MTDQGPPEDAARSQTASTDLSSVFGDRYEIHREIGSGGMAKVYLGRDRLLDRPVAVKVLSSAYSSDQSFVERFRSEATAAAKLNHPGIVAIFDWGERDNTPYIVMEYVEGRTLAEILRSEGRLHPDRAAEIAIDVAAALGFAHRNGVIHRDVKPGNILVTDGGQVKVGDFGIAELSSRPSDLTKAGTVIGTAAYLSPEHAQGRSLDPRSDVYALGCVLYEMLTSRPPFTGSSPAEIAAMHVREEPAPPNELGSRIPPDLEAVCMKMLAKDPARRYASAEDARADLRRFREGQPVLAEPAGVVDLGDLDDDAVEVYEPQRRVGMLVFSLVLLLLVLAGLLALLVDSLTSDDAAFATELVPDVVGMEVGEARDAMAEAGFIPITQFEENDDFPENTVFAQDPPDGTKLEVGSEVQLLVSSGSSILAVPEVVGLQSTVARSVLESAGFEVKETKDWHELAAIGEVIRQDPAARRDAPIGAEVTIVVSKGPKPVEIPDLEGKTEIEAANTLENLGFEFAFFEEESEDVEEGKVSRTDPPAGEKLAPGSTVTVFISTGKFVLMPDVVGLEVEQAINVLRGEGLQPSTEIQELPAGHPDDGKVIGQDPPPEEEVQKGSIVVIRVGIAPDAATPEDPDPEVDVFVLSHTSIPASPVAPGEPLDQMPLLTWATTGGSSVSVTGPGVSDDSRDGSVRVCPGTKTGSSCVFAAGSYTYTLRLFDGGRQIAKKEIVLIVTP